MAGMGSGSSGSGVAGMAGLGLGTPPAVVARAAPKTGPVRVSSGTVAGMILSRPDPVYPPIAKAAHVQGVVILHAIISKTGTIEGLQVVSGPPMLTGSAMDAVKRWRYKPYLLNGEPTEVDTTINVNFTFGGG
jgi:protein TonB